MNPKTIKMIQRFVAFDCIGPSSLRNQGAGVISATREYLAGINLRNIPRTNQKAFRKWIDHHTHSLLDTLPIRNRPWGSARKALNLFLRSALYNHYLRKEYKIRAIEQFLEIPLDKVVATALKRHAGRGALPQWPGLKHLTPPISEPFQEYATIFSKELNLPFRVLLDNYLWLKYR